MARSHIRALSAAAARPDGVGLCLAARAPAVAHRWTRQKSMGKLEKCGTSWGNHGKSLDFFGKKCDEWISFLDFWWRLLFSGIWLHMIEYLYDNGMLFYGNEDRWYLSLRSEFLLEMGIEIIEICWWLHLNNMHLFPHLNLWFSIGSIHFGSASMRGTWYFLGGWLVFVPIKFHSNHRVTINPGEKLWLS